MQNTDKKTSVMELAEAGYPNLFVEPVVAKKNNRTDCKPPLKYVHPKLTHGVAYGMLAGELKYGAWNFALGHDLQDLLDGAQRHLDAYRHGELVDTDTTERLRAEFGDKAPEISHLWLAASNINMILWQIEYGTLRNGIPTKPVG